MIVPQRCGPPALRACQRTVVLAVVFCAALVSAAGSASAQAVAHPAPPSARPLHLRLAEADAAAIVVVTGVDRGRITVTREAGLLGRTPERFEIKRSPLNPPPLAAHDRALVFLRGARPPYVLVDEPRETIRLANEASAERWAQAVRDAARDRDDPRALASLYARWLDEGPESLRDLAFQGLVEPELDTPEVRAHLAPDRADAASRGELPPRVRQLSALLAVRTPEGSAQLLEGALIDPVEPGVIGMALRGGITYGNADTGAVFAAAVRSDDAAVRLAGAQAMVGVRGELAATVRPRLETLAADDPDPRVREVAGRLLVQLARSAE